MTTPPIWREVFKILDIRVLHHDFFGSAKKEGEPLHINGGIEADGKAVGLMQHPPGARGKPIHIYRFAPCTGDLF